MSVNDLIKTSKPMASRIGLKMTISEKAYAAQQYNQVVFEVRSDATKGQIAKAIEESYKVKPIKIRTMVVSSKRRRRGRTTGWTAARKKAIVAVDDLKNFNVAP